MTWMEQVDAKKPFQVLVKLQRKPGAEGGGGWI